MCGEDSDRTRHLPQEDIYPHQAPAINLIDSIFDPSCNRSPASLGVAAMEVIEAACISAKSGQNVLVPQPDGAKSMSGLSCAA